MITKFYSANKPHLHCAAMDIMKLTSSLTWYNQHFNKSRRGLQSRGHKFSSEIAKLLALVNISRSRWYRTGHQGPFSTNAPDQLVVLVAKNRSLTLVLLIEGKGERYHGTQCRGSYAKEELDGTSYQQREMALKNMERCQQAAERLNR